MQPTSQTLPSAPAVAPLGLSTGAVLKSHESGLHYKVLRRLGAGSFGQVFLCKEGRSGNQRAVKVMPCEQAAAMAVEVAQVRRAVNCEGNILVPKFYEASEASVLDHAGSKLLLISMEYIDGASAGHLAALQPFPEAFAKPVLCDVASALSRLHEIGLMHRDVKGDNVLVSRSGASYLCDFGVSAMQQELQEAEGQLCGTPYYVAPELLYDAPRYSPKADVWAFGITAMELATGKAPLQRQQVFELEEVFYRVATSAAPRLPGGDYSLTFTHMVSHALVREPEQRASMDDLLDSVFLQSVNAGHRDCLRTWVEKRLQEEEGR